MLSGHSLPPSLPHSLPLFLSPFMCVSDCVHPYLRVRVLWKQCHKLPRRYLVGKNSLPTLFKVTVFQATEDLQEYNTCLRLL